MATSEQKPQEQKPLEFKIPNLEGVEKPIKNVVFRVSRFDPDKDSKPYYKDYEVPVYRFTTVLDGLIYIKYNLDPTLAVRYSCRMGVCGSCAMVVNGRERLACKTNVLSLNSSIVTVRPLNNLPLIRDIVTDLRPFLEKHRKVMPYIIRDDIEAHQDREFLQSPAELDEYMMLTDCIKCGLCYSACPTTATDELFLGPQALAQAYRYTVDTRDAGAKQRFEIVDSPHGVWRCHFAGACSAACPKGVDPAFAIQQLKKLILYRRGAMEKRKPAPESDKVREGISVEEVVKNIPKEWPSPPAPK
ncbi:MAG: succinate dehydrogenase/fumarate reductase iron-sulfur subunit [Conexivisphaera sp.]|jgi:succinate dehydrogenase / fumarate reductase iron-sulfur subunit|nr:succinate dehydrogenase iron-sulfur subunit [Conexivisphaerales archaeon]